MPRKLNNGQIEKASVEAVIRYFNYSETLDPNIPTTDKTPVWDGNLFLYKSNSDKQSKTGLIGTIPSQVKGRQFKDFSNSIIQYPIDVNDVGIYTKNGGIAFFVVYINADTEDTKIYYRLLAPIELRKIAKLAGNKKTTRIDFYELPERDKVIELQFLNFYNDCLRQHSFSKQPPIDIQSIDESKASISVQFSSPSQNHFETLKYLTTNPQFCYVKYNDDPTNTLHPLGDGRFKLAARDIADFPVIVGEKQYYESVGVEMINGKTSLVIDGLWRIPSAESADEIGKQYNQEILWNFKTLSQRIRFFEFLLDAEQNGVFSIGKWEIKVNNLSERDNMQRILDADKNLKSIFDRLNVRTELNIQNMSPQDIQNANSLIDYYIFGKRVTSTNLSNYHFERIEINNIILQFFAEKIEEPNYFRLHSIHDLSSIAFSTENELGQHVLMPSFFAFNMETYRDVANISFENFVAECDGLKSNDNRFYQGINWSILRMLQAYDLQENKKQVLIETALSLDQWLMENDPDENTWFIHKINEIQIKKRMQGLSESEKEFLFETIETDKSNDEVKFACYTLLDNKEFAERCFNKLPEETQSFVKELPIYNLFNSLS